MSEVQKFSQQVRRLIDELKSVCANYGLGNDGNEFKIITQVFLYKFLHDKFVFEGFLPVKKGRQTRLKLLAEETRTMIFYESPHKLIKTLSHFCEYLGEERQVSVSRELTKLYEETIRGTAKEVLEYYSNKPPKGEIVIVVEGKK